MKKLTSFLGVVAVALLALAAGLYIGKALLPGAASKSDPRDELIKGQVQSAYTVLDQLNKKAQAGEIKLSYAKKLGADILREMRYDQDGYFFVDTSKGVNVVLYGDKTVEGKDRHDANLNGIYYVQKIAEAAQKGNGYTDYFFPKKGETTPSAKRAYSMYFQPFDWVIGTGYYR